VLPRPLRSATLDTLCTAAGLTGSKIVAAGFEVVFPESDPAILAKCAEASVIAGVEGSNMVHQLFMPPGGTVLCFADLGWSDQPYVPTAAAAAGHRCIFVVGPHIEVPISSASRWSNSVDFTVPLPVLQDALRALTVAPSAAPAVSTS